jgi:hypothetical protein
MLIKNKLAKSEVFEDHSKSGRQLYVKDEVHWASTCCVCGFWLNSRACKTNQSTCDAAPLPMSGNVIEIDDYYYIVPIEHRDCRKLFELNPLSYISNE